MIDVLYKYIKDIKTKKINAGLEIKQAISRFESDLKRSDIEFSEQKAIKAITFISHLKHFTGKYDNKNFILEPWQVFVVSNIFGWIVKETGARKYTSVYCEVARKNGKTQLAAAISLYFLIAEGEANAEAVLAANSREQAKLAFSAVSKMSQKLDPQEKYIRSYRNEVKYQNNLIKIVSSDSSKLDGMNCSLVILDEYHAASTSLVHDVLKSSQGSRENPLFIIITTAGFNKNSPCFSARKTAKEVLIGLKHDDSQFIAIYSQDEKDNWTDEKNWIKSNPNLDVTVKRSFIKDEINKAQNNISLETGVKTKNLNMWCDTVTTWIPDTYILKSSKKLNINDVDEETEIFVGVDLSSTTDITAVSYMWIIDEKYHFITNYYLPEDSLNSAIDKEYYKVQHNKGNLKIVSGNVVDYDIILNDILDIGKKHNIVKLFYDNWNSTQFVIQATQNLNCEAFSQSIGNFSRPTKDFERSLLNGKVVIDDNEITRWMLSNVYLRVDANGNVKPDKSKKKSKIDGIISMLMCLGGFLLTPHYNITII